MTSRRLDEGMNARGALLGRTAPGVNFKIIRDTFVHDPMKRASAAQEAVTPLSLSPLRHVEGALDTYECHGQFAKMRDCRFEDGSFMDHVVDHHVETGPRRTCD